MNDKQVADRLGLQYIQPKQRYGKIIVRVSQCGYKQEYRTYEVEGRVFRFDVRVLEDIGIKFENIKRGTRFSVGGIPLLVTDYDMSSFTVDVIREKSTGWRLYYFVFDPLVNLVNMFYGRILMTLWVWNLAKGEAFEIPNINWVVRRWTRK